MVSDLYSNTQVMTGEVLSGLGSSAAILYYNDTVTYEDGRSEPMDLQVVPLPMTAEAEPLMTQSGVGLCAYKTTQQKAEAASLFAHWLTEAERNLDFVTSTGYMPVRNGAFDFIDESALRFCARPETHKTEQEKSRPCQALSLTGAALIYASVVTWT